MVRQAHHPEQSRRINLKLQYPITKTGLKNERPTLSSTFIFFLFAISNFGNCGLFVICDLIFGISSNPVHQGTDGIQTDPVWCNKS